MRMRAEFVCNMPGPADCPDLIACFPMSSATEPRIFVDVDRAWPRHGENLIGPPINPSGGPTDPGDVGIYDISNWPDARDPIFKDKVNEFVKAKRAYPKYRPLAPIPDMEIP